jgi:uncharacterized RDD family membrane protein YckC
LAAANAATTRVSADESPDGGTDESPYAGIVTRTVALAIDATALTIGFAVTSAIVGLILSLFTGLDVSSAGTVLGTAACWTVVVIGYFTLSWAAAGQTAGMWLMRIRVVDSTGEPPHLARSALRLVGAVLGAIPLFAGYFLVLFDARRRAFHDMLAGTVVVYSSAVSFPGSSPSEPQTPHP